MSLTSPDPLFILPVLNGMVSFLQQKMMNTSGTQNQQAKTMMYMFPVMMIFISYKMPGRITNLLVNIYSSKCCTTVFNHETWR